MIEITLITYSNENRAFTFHLEAQPFTRKTIYGSRKVVALDKNGDQCKTAQLSSDGTEIYPSGGTGYIKLAPDGTIYDSNDLDTQEQYEESLHTFTLGDRNYSMKKVQSESQLNFFYEQEIEKLYLLTGINADELMKYINDDLYEVYLNNFRKGYLICRNRKLFLEVSKDISKCIKNSDFIKKDNYDYVSDSEVTLEEIDFGMM